MSHDWGQPRITWNGAVRQIKDVVIKKIESVPAKYDKRAEPPPPPSTASSSTTGKQRNAPTTPRSKKEDPNVFCKILKLDGTSVNNQKALALENYAATQYNKHLTEVIKKILNFLYYQMFQIT